MPGPFLHHDNTYKPPEGYGTNEFSGNGILMSAAEIKDLQDKLHKFSKMVHADKSENAQRNDWHNLSAAESILHRYYMFTKFGKVRHN